MKTRGTNHTVPIGLLIVFCRGHLKGSACSRRPSSFTAPQHHTPDTNAAFIIMTRRRLYRYPPELTLSHLHEHLLPNDKDFIPLKNQTSNARYCTSLKEVGAPSMSGTNARRVVPYTPSIPLLRRERRHEIKSNRIRLCTPFTGGIVYGLRPCPKFSKFPVMGLLARERYSLIPIWTG